MLNTRHTIYLLTNPARVELVHLLRNFQQYFLSLSVPLSVCLSLSHTHTNSLSFSLSHTLFLFLSVTLSLTHTHSIRTFILHPLSTSLPSSLPPSLSPSLPLSLPPSLPHKDIYPCKHFSMYACIVMCVCVCMCVCVVFLFCVLFLAPFGFMREKKIDVEIGHALSRLMSISANPSSNSTEHQNGVRVSQCVFV